MKTVKVKVKSNGIIGWVYHVESLLDDRFYIVRTKGSGGGYYSLPLFKGSQLEVIQD